MEHSRLTDNFIGVFEDALSPQHCDTLIKDYKRFEEAGVVWKGAFKDGFVTDQRTSYPCQSALTSLLPENKRTFLWDTIANCCEQYMLRYPEALPDPIDRCRMMVEDIMIQKTDPGGGFHVWHYEAMNLDTTGRFLTWILYLNDIEEGGETEFLYQRARISPKAGTMVVWPTGFTHTHRGNPPLEETKYIITGWHRWLR